jgi:hypothetical protein
MPWVEPADNRAFLDQLVRIIKRPSQWPRLRHLFKDRHHMNSAEALLFAGPLGVYYLQMLTIDQKYKDLFIDLIFLLERLQSKMHTTKSLDRLQAELVDVLSNLEVNHSTACDALHIMQHTLKLMLSGVAASSVGYDCAPRSSPPGGIHPSLWSVQGPFHAFFRTMAHHVQGPVSWAQRGLDKSGEPLQHAVVVQRVGLQVSGRG